MQARTQTFEKGDANLRFLQRGANLMEILILRPPWFHITVGTMFRSNHGT